MSEFTKHIVTCAGYGSGTTESGSKNVTLEHRQGQIDRNVRIKLQRFVDTVVTIKSRYKDLLIIAGYLFAADRKIGRGKIDATEYHSWSRRIHLHIGVTDLEFWESNEIKLLLNEVLVWMTGDDKYEFTFYRAEEDLIPTIFTDDNFNIEKEDDIKVMLFSGGLDSLSGAIESLETTEKHICLVSHQSGQTKVKGLQKRIYEALKEKYPYRISHYKYECGLSGEDSRDESQRTRSFLYTSTAFVVAKAYGQDKIYVYENGITSINFPETQDQMNARASRTTHPKTLNLLEKLFTVISGSSFTIKNDFMYKTKTEIVEVLKKYERLDLLDSSVSCSRTRDHTDSSTHCGICSQCIDRRFATYAAAVEDFDENGIYDFDFLRESLKDKKAKNALNEYIRAAQNVRDETISGFYKRLGPEIVELEPYINGKNEGERVQNIYELYRTHSENIENAISRMQLLHDKPLQPRNPNSFFAMIIAPKAYQMNGEVPEVESKIKKEDRSEESEAVNRELANAHTLIKRQKRRINILEKGITKAKLEEIIDKKCRKKNNKINYSELGRQLGCSHHTAKDKCNYYGIT